MKITIPEEAVNTLLADKLVEIANSLRGGKRRGPKPGTKRRRMKKRGPGRPPKDA